MKAFLILADGTVYEGESIGSTREVISEIVFNTSMTGYLEILTDPSYCGQSVVMTYPLIGNYGVCYEDMEDPEYLKSVASQESDKAPKSAAHWTAEFTAAEVGRACAACASCAIH